MLIGYASISTHDQTLHLQQDALKKAGCEKIFTDRVSGTKEESKGLSPTVTLSVIGLRSVGWSTLEGPILGTLGLFLVLNGVSRNYSMGHLA